MDKLHARTVPLFMTDDQAFIWGGDLKTDLKRLDEHYTALPDEIKQTGVWTFARTPPVGDVFLTAQLWDRFMSPTWRQPKEARPKTPDEITKDREALEEFKSLKSESTPVDGLIGLEDTAFVILERQVPVRLGKWQIVPPEVVEAQRNSKDGANPKQPDSGEN